MNTEKKIQELFREVYLPNMCYDGTCEHYARAQYKYIARTIASDIDERGYAFIVNNVSKYAGAPRRRVLHVYINDDGDIDYDVYAPLTPAGASYLIEILEHIHGYAKHEWVDRLDDAWGAVHSLSHASEAMARACADAKRDVRSDMERRATIARLRHTITDYDDINKRNMSDDEVAQLRREYNKLVS